MKREKAHRAPVSFRRRLPSAGVPAAVLGLHAWLATAPDLRLTVALPVVWLAVSALLAIALFLADRGHVAWRPGTVLAVAAACRLLFVFRLPELSDDIYRYLWDGLHTLSGANPYAFAPSRVTALSPALAELLPWVNHPELVTIYPPVAQLFFALGALLGGLATLKVLAAAIDLATCWLLMRILSSLGLPASRSVLYAWAPLPVLEIAGSGHVDAVAVFLLVLAFTAVLGRPERVGRALGAGAALASAALVKVFPGVLLPGLLQLAGKRRATAFWAGAILTAAALCFPFVPAVRNAFGTLGAYARHWEFAGFPFRALRQALGSGDEARLVLVAAFTVTWALAWRPLLRGREPASGSAVLRAGYGIALAFLLLSPTLHPWYALYLAWLLPFAAEPAGLVLCGAVVLVYAVLPGYALLGEWVEPRGVAALLWGAAVLSGVLGLLARRSRPGPP